MQQAGRKQEAGRARDRESREQGAGSREQEARSREQWEQWGLAVGRSSTNYRRPVGGQQQM